MQLRRSRALRHVAALVAVAATLAVGCNDDTPTVTVDADNYEDLALSVSEATYRAAVTPMLLTSLGYMIETGRTPDAAIAGDATGARGPNAGLAQTFSCSGGTFDQVLGDLEWTTTFDNCGVEFFDCSVNGQLRFSDARLNAKRALEFQSIDLEFDCPWLDDEVAFDGDRVICELPFDTFEDCEPDLKSFTTPHSGRRVRFGDIDIHGAFSSPAFAVDGEIVDSHHGRVDIETEDELDFTCEAMPSHGVMIFGGNPPTVGSIEYDSDCEAMRVCLWPDDQFDEETECSSVAYPGADPPA